MKLYTIFCWMLLICSTDACNRRPQGASGDRTPVNENFQILIDGNPSTYIPGQQYNISISCTSGVKFISFTLVVESENSDSNGYDTVGHFELIDLAETRFSLTCENMIESSNTNSKSRIDVAWVAPKTPNIGCLLIKAAVLQHRNVWFIDDGFLTKRICPEETDDINSQTPLVDPCCACDEAKYEIILQRKWSRNTHPKDFPAEAWRTRLSEIIGASHSINYTFWMYGSRASLGLQEMAEHGATATLEDEIKSNINTGEIRTIIKAPGIVFRNNAMGTTLANVRVDPRHHLISLVTKLEPSPDWILGVARLELCLSNCTWIEKKILNLYPWDVGTDAGPTYLSPDQPQIPPDVIRRITSSFPSDHHSPFYDNFGAPIKPLGTLHITRKKLYERICEEAENQPLECATHPWNTWTDCSTKCGPGIQYRSRAYKDPELAESFNCNMQLSQQQSCLGSQCGLSDEDHFDVPALPECAISEWSDWSSCSTRCGKGVVSRTRSYIHPHASVKCQGLVPVQMEETEGCFGNDCGGSIRNGYNTQYNMESQFENNANYEVTPSRTNDMTESIGFPNGEIYSQKLEQPSNLPQNGNIHDYHVKYGQQNIAGKYQRNSLTNLITPQAPKNNIPPMPNIMQPTPETINEKPPGIYVAWDEFGHKATVVEGTDINKYAVVQKYCFEKPIPSQQRCDLTTIGVENYWFYDSDDSQCKIFTTDKCDENKNKFRTLEACEETCYKPQKILYEELRTKEKLPTYAKNRIPKEPYYAQH